MERSIESKEDHSGRRRCVEKPREAKNQSLKEQELKVLQRQPACAHTEGQGLVVQPQDKDDAQNG